MKKMINAIREIQLKCLEGVEEETWAEREEEGEPGLEIVLDVQSGGDQGNSAAVPICREQNGAEKMLTPLPYPQKRPRSKE